MRKIIILLSVLGLLNLNVSATETPDFFSKYFLKEGLTHTESNVVLNGGTIWNTMTIVDYYKDAAVRIIPAGTVGYERKYSDDSSILFNITAGSVLEFKKGNWETQQYFEKFIIRGDLLWTCSIFRTESTYIDYGFGLNVAVELDRDINTKHAVGICIIPIYLSLNYQFTDNVTGMVAVIPALDIMLYDKILPVSFNDSLEIGIKIKM